MSDKRERSTVHCGPKSFYVYARIEVAELATAAVRSAGTLCPRLRISWQFTMQWSSVGYKIVDTGLPILSITLWRHCTATIISLKAGGENWSRSLEIHLLHQLTTENGRGLASRVETVTGENRNRNVAIVIIALSLSDVKTFMRELFILEFVEEHLLLKNNLKWSF